LAESGGFASAAFLERAQCYLGGGTRIVLALGEYRESAKIDLLCSGREGYRELRSTIGARSLGEMAAWPLKRARDNTADRYRIRSFVEVGADKLKFEIVNEARIELSGARLPGVPVACLDEASCFAEKLLANDDRWTDESLLSRDVIDLAYMIEDWGREPFREGARAARWGCGNSVPRAACEDGSQ